MKMNEFNWFNIAWQISLLGVLLFNNAIFAFLSLIGISYSILDNLQERYYERR